MLQSRNCCPRDRQHGGLQGREAGLDLEDFAQEPGHYQSFPVIAPSSLVKHGPQDIRSPREVHANLVSREQQDDAWVFTRDRAQAEMAHESVLLAGFRKRAAKAEREARIDVDRDAVRLQEVERSVDERKRACDVEIRAMRARLQEAETRRDETETSCRARVEESQELLKNEWEHTAKLEALLKSEQKRTGAALARVAEAEAQSAARLAARDVKVEQARLEAKERAEAAHTVSEDRIRLVEEQYAADVQLVSERGAAVRNLCQGRVELEAGRQASTEGRAKERTDVAAMRLDLDTYCIKQHKLKHGEDATKFVERVQEREKDAQVGVGKKIARVAPLFDFAARMSLEANRRELQSIASLEVAAHTLGKHVETRVKYTGAVDDCVSKVLRCTLHAEAGTCEFQMAPSARSLPPPGSGNGAMASAILPPPKAPQDVSVCG